MRTKLKALMCLVLICGLTTFIQARHVNYTFPFDPVYQIQAYVTDNNMSFSSSICVPATVIPPDLPDGFLNTRSDADIQHFKDKDNNYYVAFYWDNPSLDTHGVKIWKLSYDLQQNSYAKKWEALPISGTLAWSCVDLQVIIHNFTVKDNSGLPEFNLDSTDSNWLGTWNLCDTYRINDKGKWIHKRTQTHISLPQKKL